MKNIEKPRIPAPPDEGVLSPTGGRLKPEDDTDEFGLGPLPSENVLGTYGGEAKIGRIAIPTVSGLEIKPGWKTTSGQITGLLTIVFTALSFLGFSKMSSAEINTTGEAIANAINAIGPLIALIPIVMNYVNSRGKITSNEITARALVSASESQPQLIEGLQAQGLFGKFKLKHIGQAMQVGSALGIPGVGAAGMILDKARGSETRALTDKDIIEAFTERDRQTGEALTEIRETLGDLKNMLNKPPTM